MTPDRFDALVATGNTLVIFLRHNGCIFPKEVIQDVRRIVDRDDTFPKVLFVAQGEEQANADMFNDLWPEATVISDPKFQLFDRFGVKRASLGQVLSPSVLACGLRAYRKGARQKGVIGDPMRMPGALLVQDGHVRKRFEPRHVADAPDWDLWSRSESGEIASVPG